MSFFFASPDAPFGRASPDAPFGRGEGEGLPSQGHGIVVMNGYVFKDALMYKSSAW